MQLPYSNSPNDAFMAAQGALGGLLTAIVWQRPLKPTLASIAMIAAIWLAVLMPIQAELVGFVGVKLPKENAGALTLSIACALSTVAMLLNRGGRGASARYLGAVALAGELTLLWVAGKLQDSDWEFAGLHLLWFGVLLGLHARVSFPESRPAEPIARGRSYLRQDLVIGLCATAVAGLVAWFVLERALDSADEWGYLFNAHLLAHGKAFGSVPDCPEPHRNHWVFFYKGRAFAQYLPGWSLFIAPFIRLHVVWLAGPASFGLMAAGVARLGRRAAGEAGGIIAVLVACTGACTLINAGSLYSHIYTTMLWVWAVEAVCVLTETGLSTRAQWGWGLVLGAATSVCFFTRPSDGGLIGAGVFFYFVYAMWTKKIGRRGFFGTAISFSLVSAIALTILRLQLGAWFKTGYDVAEQFYSWAKPTFSVPARDAWKYSFPFATFGYCFWPAAPAVGVIGLIMLGRRLSFMLSVTTFGLLAFYTALEFGRYHDFGYGPRYHLPLIVPCAIGMAVVLAPLFTALRRRWLTTARGVEGPAVLAFASIVFGVVRIAPDLYPYAHTLLHRRAALRRSFEEYALQHAVVTVQQGDTDGGPLLDTQNDPTDLDLPVIVLAGSDLDCTRKLYSDRKFYRATGSDEVKLIPYP